MKIKYFLGSVILMQVIFLQSAHAARICETHETCLPYADCACTVAADAMYDRSYYFDFPTIRKGQTYECKLIGDEPDFLLKESTLPPGSKISQCTNDCSFFSVTFLLDTSAMQDEQATLTLKYSVPASDIPTDVAASCKEK